MVKSSASIPYLYLYLYIHCLTLILSLPDFHPSTPLSYLASLTYISLLLRLASSWFRTANCFQPFVRPEFHLTF